MRGIGSKGKYTSTLTGRTVSYQSSYEREFMKYLDSRGVIWERNTKRFPYEGDGKIHHYIPDFYLPTLDYYVETKGFVRANDPVKFEAFPFKLALLTYKELIDLGCDVKDPTQYANADLTKWPMSILTKDPNWQSRGELSLELAEKVNPRKLLEWLKSTE